MITDLSQRMEPPDSRGGLLADQMGLGKSLTVISLIALNPSVKRESLVFISQGTLRRLKSTLLVVPYTCEFVLIRVDKLVTANPTSAGDMEHTINSVSALLPTL